MYLSTEPSRLWTAKIILPVDNPEESLQVPAVAGIEYLQRCLYEGREKQFLCTVTNPTTSKRALCLSLLPEALIMNEALIPAKALSEPDRLPFDRKG